MGDSDVNVQLFWSSLLLGGWPGVANKHKWWEFFGRAMGSYTCKDAKVITLLDTTMPEKTVPMADKLKYCHFDAPLSILGH